MHRTRWSPIRDLLIGGVKVLATLLAAPLLRNRYNQAGATAEERQKALPGDDLVPNPKLGYTRAITIDAPPVDVWPWLVQIGQGRGGLYSYDTLENIVGCGIHSVDEILPEHQHPAAGDIIRSGGDNYPCWIIMDIQPPHHLILQGAGTPAEVDVPDVVDDVPARGYAASTWQWVLEPAANGRHTRLIVRQRSTYSPRQSVLWHIVEPLNYVMEQEMLRGIKRRAEHRIQSATSHARS